MTGVLSIVRESFSLFSETPNPSFQKNLFWSCVWVAFIVSSFAAWVIEHKKRKELERQNNKLQEDIIPVIEIVQKQDELTRENINLRNELEREQLNIKTETEKHKETVEELNSRINYLLDVLEPKLEILFEKTYVATTHYPFQNRNNPEYFRIARVVIRNDSKDTIYGIKVALKDLPIDRDALNGRVFRLKDDFNEHSSGSFSLDPDETQEIDIALRKETHFKQEEGSYLRLVAPKHVNKWIGDAEIIGLKIQVTASRHPAIEGRFDIYLEKTQSMNQDGEVKFFKRLMFRVSEVDADAPTEIRPYRDKAEDISRNNL